MSTIKVIVNVVQCDACGRRFEMPGADGYTPVSVMEARVAAGVAGWRFGQLGRQPKPRSEEKRDWDWCPKCEDPRPGVSS